MQHKVRQFQAAVPLLDTSKLVHIWYTTKATHGWFVLEFNDSSVAINLEYAKWITLGAAHFGLITARNARFSSANTEKLHNE